MGATGDTVKLEIIVDDKGSLVIKNFKDIVNKSMGEVSTQSALAGSSMSGMWQSVMAGQMATQIATKFLSGLKEIVMSSGVEFLEADKIQRQFEATLNNVGIGTNRNIKIFDDFAKGIQKTTTVDDEAVKSLMGLGLRMGFTGDTIRDATLSAIGLSKAFSINLESAMQMVLQATEGNYRGIQQYLPVLKNTKDEGEKFAIVQEAIAGGLKLASAETRGLAGEMAQSQNAINDNKERMGELVAQLQNLVYKALIPATEMLVVFFDTLRRVDERQIKDTTTRQFLDNKAAFEAAATAAGVLDEAQKKLFEDHGNITATQKGIEIYGEALDDLIAQYPKAAAGFNEYFKVQQGVDLENKKITISTNGAADAILRKSIADYEAKKAADVYKESLKILDVTMQQLQTTGFEVSAGFKLSTISTDENTFSLNQNKKAVEGVTFAIETFQGTDMATTLSNIDNELKDYFIDIDKVLPKTDAFGKKIIYTSAATEKWYQDAQDLAAGLQALANVFDDLIPGLGGVISGMMGAYEATAKFAVALENKTATFGGFLGALGAVIGGIQALAKAADAYNKAQARDFIKGMNEFMDVSDDMAEKIRILAEELQKLHGFQKGVWQEPGWDEYEAATSKALDDIINATDLTADNFDKYAIRVRGILSDLDRGMLTEAETAKEMGDAFEALMRQAKELGTEGSAELIAMYEDLAARGIRVKEVQDYINASLNAGLAGYKAMKAAMTLPDGVLATAEQMRNAMAATEAFGNMNIQVFEDMIAYEKHVAENQGLVDGIEGATAAMVGLSNAQRLTQEQFADFATAGYIAYQKLEAGGMSDVEAMKTMAPYLQRLQFLHEQYGYTIDDATQKLIDEGIASGTVFENQKSETTRMVEALESLVEMFRGALPKALVAFAESAIGAFGKARDAASGFSDELGNIPNEWNYAGKGGQDVYAASGWHGWVAGGSNKRFTAGDGVEPERVDITPMSQYSRRSGSDAAPSGNQSGAASGGNQRGDTYYTFELHNVIDAENVLDIIIDGIDGNKRLIRSKLQSLER